MDPPSYNTMLQIQLEDTMELASTSKGKQREGTICDAEMALQMYIADLKACPASMSDRKMAQSIAIAVIRDAQFIHQDHLESQQIARDRELAAALQNDAPVSNPNRPEKKQNESDVWQDSEMLSKVAALYMPEPSASFTPGRISDSDSDDTTMAESSTRAAKRDAKAKPKLGHCIACGEDKDFFDVARVPCNHEYCKSCRAELFRLSMADETLFPPRCDSQEILLRQVRFFLPSDLAKDFEAKYVELSTKNRTYCHDRACMTFIPMESINNEVATCPRCRRTTCTTCKDPSHSGDCPEDTALQQLLETANDQQWQRCYACNRVVELETGCNHDVCLRCQLRGLPLLTCG
jgi:hypothetical protein